MRWRSILALLSLVLVPPLVGGAGALAHAQDIRPGIAVFPFDNGGSYGDKKENYDALERGIAGMMISELASNPGTRVVERETLQKLIEEQNLGASGRVDPQTAAKIGKIVGARYVVLGTFLDFYGDFRIDARLVNVETSEIMKTESDRLQRDHLFDLIRTVASRLMKDANLPPLPKDVSQQRMSREIPTEALTYYSRALLYQDRKDKAKAIDMYKKALDAFPEYTEAKEGLERVSRS